MVEGLSRLIIAKNAQGAWEGISLHHSQLLVTHKLFVDDSLLYGKGSLQEAQVIKETLEVYYSFSGQKLNKSKSKIFFFNLPRSIQSAIQKLLGFEIALTPSKYLGIPLFQGSCKDSFWDNIVQSIRDRIASWKAS